MVLSLASTAWAGNPGGKLRTLVSSFKGTEGFDVVDLGGPAMLLLKAAVRAEADDPEDRAALAQLFDQVVGRVLGLQDEDASASGKAEKALEGVMGLVLEARKKAREEKNWAESDRIRDTLASFGITVKDTKDGATWTLE